MIQLTMVMSTVALGVSLVTISIAGLIGAEEDTVNQVVGKEQVAEYIVSVGQTPSVMYDTTEVDLNVFGTPLPIDTATPLSYIETREILLEMREEKLEEIRFEREQIILAHLEAMEKIEAERVQAEQAEAEQAEAERLAKELAEEQATAKSVSPPEQPVTVSAEDTETVTESNEITTSTTSKEVEEPKEQESTPQPSQVASSYLLAQLVESEAKGEPYEGKVAVAEVVLARVRSSQFPNSIEGVIYQKGQFQVVSNGSINNAPSQESINASNEALSGSNYSNGALFFYNPRIATDRWQDSLRTTAVIGNHTFKNH